MCNFAGLVDDIHPAEIVADVEVGQEVADGPVYTETTFDREVRQHGRRLDARPREGKAR